jgi:hypothetical protein
MLISLGFLSVLYLGYSLLTLLLHLVNPLDIRLYILASFTDMFYDGNCVLQTFLVDIHP